MVFGALYGIWSLEITAFSVYSIVSNPLLARLMDTLKTILCLGLFIGMSLCEYEENLARIDSLKELLSHYLNDQKNISAGDTSKYQTVLESLDDIIEKHPISEEDRTTLLDFLKQNPIFEDIVAKCQETLLAPSCNYSSPYRTYDGTCNNLLHPTWGASGACLLRILPARYEGTFGIPKSENGRPLPEPRDLSLLINIDRNIPNYLATNLFIIFGQSIAHDISLATPPTGPNLDALHKCCPPSNKDPECFPIIIRPDDPFYSKRNITCLNFSRATVCKSCEIAKRSAANTATSAIDASLIYGNSEEQASGLRTNDGTGKLKSRYTYVGELLQANTDPAAINCPEKPLCFVSGDSRVNQHTPIASMHTLYTREHNRLAEKLKEINPGWDDETLYQEARRIFGAKLQAIVFKEYTPLLIGQTLAESYRLTNTSGNGGTTYNPYIRLGVFAEASTSGFRLHSMINSRTGFLQFRYLYSNPHPILDGKMDELLTNLYHTPPQQFDRFLVTDITDFLFKQPGDDFGLDLSSIDIQRGRDHGLPNYVDIANHCYRDRLSIASFDDLKQVISPESVELLQSIYTSYKDIDLFVGMNVEQRLAKSILNPLSACLAAEQLYVLKYGDRYYYEHENQVSSFTSEQRQALQHSTLSRLICDNTNIKELQRNVFLLPSFTNPILPCNNHLDVDLNLWKAK